MRRIFALLLALCCLLPVLAYGEETLTLLNADTLEEVNQFILLPEGDELPAPQRGMIRYISLNESDAAFRSIAWKNNSYNLMSRDGGYTAIHSAMHNRAVYCMALSYLGVDVTPVMMSQLAGTRDVSAPYDAVTAQLDVKLERVEPKAYHFDTMVENYLNDVSYSPVMCTFRRPSGELYTVLIVGYIPSTGGFIVVDAAGPVLEGENMHAYKMAWHVVRQVILASDFWAANYGSEVVSVYQWHLVED
nr:hypothetical protein [Clostridia bacterium]